MVPYCNHIVPVFNLFGQVGVGEPYPDLEACGSLRFRLIDNLHIKDQQAFWFSR